MKSLLEIGTEGVRKGKKREARKEFRSLVRSLFRKEIPMKIIVAKDFKSSVNHYLREKLNVTIPYDPKRSWGQAAAKTIPYISNNNLHFVLIIDGAIFGEWKIQEKPGRSLTLGHEFFHVKDNILIFEAIGAKAFDEPRTSQEVVFHLANDIWHEYHAERIILDLSKKLASKNQKITFNPTPSVNQIENLREIVGEILPFLQSKIDDFRKRHLTIGDLWCTAYLRIRGMLVLAAYVAAISDVTREFKAEIGSVRTLKEYQFIFHNDFERIQEEFRSAYKKKNEFPKKEMENIALTLKSIFYRCGFELKDVRNRLWVETHRIIIDE